MLIGCMIWRIGEIVDPFERIRWLREHCFDAVAFWTCAGQPGVWQGFDVAAATPTDIARLKTSLLAFVAVDVHASVALPASAFGASIPALHELREAIAFAGEIRARTVTVHLDGDAPEAGAERNALATALGRLNEAAESADVQLGLELTRDYDLALREATPRVGFTLDVGHVSFDGGAGYREFGSLAGLIEHMGDRLFHVHAHDYDGVLDHLPIGAGKLDFDEIAAALKRIHYAGVVCLELNPDRATPDQLLASRDRLTGLLTGD